MSNRRRRKGCLQKKYLSLQSAHIAQRKLWGKGEYCTVYKCLYCSGWHMAANSKKRLEVAFEVIAQERITTQPVTS